jgi:hypothetical protein
MGVVHLFNGVEYGRLSESIELLSGNMPVVLNTISVLIKNGSWFVTNFLIGGVANLGNKFLILSLLFSLGELGFRSGSNRLSVNLDG